MVFDYDSTHSRLCTSSMVNPPARDNYSRHSPYFNPHIFHSSRHSSYYTNMQLLIHRKNLEQICTQLIYLLPQKISTTKSQGTVKILVEKIKGNKKKKKTERRIDIQSIRMIDVSFKSFQRIFKRLPHHLPPFFRSLPFKFSPPIYTLKMIPTRLHFLGKKIKQKSKINYKTYKTHSEEDEILNFYLVEKEEK